MGRGIAAVVERRTVGGPSGFDGRSIFGSDFPFGSDNFLTGTMIAKLQHIDGRGSKLRGAILRFRVGFRGFPRSDIDIPTVRADRHKLSVLRNDHKDITEKIDQNIQLLHSARLAPAAGKESAEDGTVGTSPFFSNSIAGGSSSAMNMDIVVSKPFAMVDEISEASPAAEDGLQLGDQIVKFGDVEIGDDLLQKLAAEMQKNQDKAVYLVVMRQGALVNLNVTPRAWPGRGLLGCHFRIL